MVGYVTLEALQCSQESDELYKHNLVGFAPERTSISQYANFDEKGTLIMTRTCTNLYPYPNRAVYSLSREVLQ